MNKRMLSALLVLFLTAGCSGETKEVHNDEMEDAHRTEIVVNKEEDIAAPVKDNQIVVYFTDGDVEEKVEQYEDFCGGKLEKEKSIPSIGYYVFTFEAKEPEVLENLIEETDSLDYVEHSEPVEIIENETNKDDFETELDKG